MITCALGFFNHGQFTICKQNDHYIIINCMYKGKTQHSLVGNHVNLNNSKENDEYD
jgi:hypothetical protein